MAYKKKNNALTIKLELSDEDIKNLAITAGSVGLSINGLLQNFIWDLIEGEYTNGSDEREYIHQWFERCRINWPVDSFLSFACREGWVDDMETRFDIIESCNEDLEESKDSAIIMGAKEELEYQKQQLIGIYQNYLDDIKSYLYSDPDTFEVGLESVSEWLSETRGMDKSNCKRICDKLS